jgi:pimeloyl-ACP methyl ester carboxylesterase
MVRTKLGLGSWLLIVALAGCTQDVGSGSGGEVESSAASLRESSLEFEVSVRGTGRATIHATVYTNESAWLGETILAVHGLAETGKTFGPLAEALFEDRALRRRIKRVIAIDLVGRGESSFPEGLPAGVTFGDLAIEDNVSTVLQSIDALRKLRLSPQTIMGHSMGGLAVQAAQQALLDQGSSLAAKGVRSAILLAPVPPHGRPWIRSRERTCRCRLRCGSRKRSRRARACSRRTRRPRLRSPPRATSASSRSRRSCS